MYVCMCVCLVEDEDVGLLPEGGPLELFLRLQLLQLQHLGVVDDAALVDLDLRQRLPQPPRPETPPLAVELVGDPQDEEEDHPQVRLEEVGDVDVVAVLGPQPRPELGEQDGKVDHQAQNGAINPRGRPVGERQQRDVVVLEGLTPSEEDDADKEPQDDERQRRDRQHPVEHGGFVLELGDKRKEHRQRRHDHGSERSPLTVDVVKPFGSKPLFGERVEQATGGVEGGGAH